MREHRDLGAVSSVKMQGWSQGALRSLCRKDTDFSTSVDEEPCLVEWIEDVEQRRSTANIMRRYCSLGRFKGSVMKLQGDWHLRASLPNVRW